MNITTCLNTTDRPENSLVFKFSLNKKQIKIFTGEKTSVKDWSTAKQQLKPSAENSDIINLKLSNLKTEIKNELQRRDYTINEAKDVCKKIVEFGHLPRYTKKLKIDHKPIIETSEDGAYSNPPDENYILVDQKFNLKDDAKEVDQTTIEEVINKYIKIASLSEGRKKHYKVTINQLKELKLNTIIIDEFNQEHLAQFRDYLIEDYDNANVTVNQKLKQIKAALKSYSPLHPATLFKNLKITKIKHPTITQQEYNSILYPKIKLSDSLQKTRDFFLFSCEVGQRWGDIYKFNKSNIIEGQWRFKQQKTKKDVAAPLNNICIEILEKYNYDLKLKTQQKYNESLKTLFETLKIDRKVNIVRYKGNQEIPEQKPLFKLASSHMGRRYFVTQSLLDKKPLSVISLITGQSLKVLQEYDQTEFDEIDNHY